MLDHASVLLIAKLMVRLKLIFSFGGFIKAIVQIHCKLLKSCTSLLGSIVHNMAGTLIEINCTISLQNPCLSEFRVPMLTDVLSTPTDVYQVG